MVRLTINGKALEVAENTTIMEAAKLAGSPVPSLCYWKGLNEIGACRVCVVEVEGIDRLVTACNRRAWWSTPTAPRSAPPGAPTCA